MRIPIGPFLAALPNVTWIFVAGACGSAPAATEGQTMDASSEGGAGEASASCPTHPAVGDFPVDVGTVLEDKCQTCHRSPPVEHAPFSLLDYEDTVGPDPIAPYVGKPIWQVMHIVIQPGGVPHMPFGSAPPLTSAEFQTLDGWLTSCAMPVAEGTGGDADSNDGGTK